MFLFDNYIHEIAFGSLFFIMIVHRKHRYIEFRLIFIDVLIFIALFHEQSIVTNYF